MKSNNTNLIVTFIMCLGALTRFIPHMPNFTLTEGLIIFGAALMSRNIWAYGAPLLIMFITDFMINNTVARSFFTDVEGIVWFSEYMIYNIMGIVAIVTLSRFLLAKINAKNILFASLSSSVVFFLITNFGSWMSHRTLYTNDFAGLLSSYEAGIPFFETSLYSSLVVCAVLFGAYYIVSSLITSKIESTSKIA